LALVGGSGYVDVRLAAPVRPSAFTYEHIPAAIAHDIRSAPRNLTLTGFLVGGPPGNSGPARGVPLGTFVYDARSRQPVQTFQLAPEAQAAPIDHVRLAVDSHHGHPRYTCLYRLRVHGTPA
jgi:SUN domain-containing protein 1/2